MEEELSENELEDRLYSMLHYVDQTQLAVPSDQDALKIPEVAPRNSLRRYWRTNDNSDSALHNSSFRNAKTPYQKVNTPYQKINTPVQKNNIQQQAALPPKAIANDAKPKEEKCISPIPSLPEHLSIFQSPAPQNIKKSIEIIETDINNTNNVVDLQSSDEDEVVEVALPPKPTITIESSDEEIIIQNSPIKKSILKDSANNGKEREVSASPVPSIVSSVSDDFIRGDCIALNISSRRPDQNSFDFNLHGSDIIASTPTKKKRKKKKGSGTSTPIVPDYPQTKPTIFDECFATPKSKAKNKKQKTKSYSVTESSIPSIDIYDSDSNQSIVEVKKNNKSFSLSDRSLPCADVYETDSNPSETVKVIVDVGVKPSNDSSDSSVSVEKPEESLARHEVTTEVTETIDLTATCEPNKDIQIEENIVIGNVTGLTEPKHYYEPINVTQDTSKYGSTKVPAILYENLDFDNLKGKEKVCKNRRYSLTTLRAEMEKFYNESWGGEDFNHREIQKNMSRDKSLWAIDPKDRMPSLNRKKYGVMCNYCNRPGHRDDTCRKKPPVCFMCGNAGHIEPRCPSKICVNCGAPNYMYSTMCRNCSTWGRIRCSECGQNGHPASHCPDIWRRYHNTIDMTPYLEQYHTMNKQQQLFCSGCTRRGHLVHACRISLPFSGLPINSPYVHMYRPIYHPDDFKSLNQRTRQSVNDYQQDSTITSATKSETFDRLKRQSKSPTAHESHVNKKRNLLISDVPEQQNNIGPVQHELPKERKSSQSKELSENTQPDQHEVVSRHTTASVDTEKAPDFIPIFSSNHDKKGQVIQDSEVSDTSDIVTSARIYITQEIANKLNSNQGQVWLKEAETKFYVSVENTEANSFLSIKGKVGDQEKFHMALRDWARDTPGSVPGTPINQTQVQQNQTKALWSHDIPKNRYNVLRKLSKALESLKGDLGEPNALYKELKYLQDRHEQLLKQKVVSPKQLDNNRGHINEMLKKLNMILLGQAGLADGHQHMQQLLMLQEKVIKLRQKNISPNLREEIGEHFHCIFTSLPRSDYGDLLQTYNMKPLNKKKNKAKNGQPKAKKFNVIPVSNSQVNRNLFKESATSVEEKNIAIFKSKSHILRKPLVEKTIKKLVFYLKRLNNAYTNDMVLKKTRAALVKQLRLHITRLNKDANTSSKFLRKMRKVQEQAQLFLSNV